MGNLPLGSDSVRASSVEASYEMDSAEFKEPGKEMDEIS